MYLDSSINGYSQQSKRKITLPLYSDDTDNLPMSNLSTPINHKPKPLMNSNFSLDLPSINSSRLTSPIVSPEFHVPPQNERRRSISPPLPPQMSPDNGRPIDQLPKTISQPSIYEQINLTKRPISLYSQVKNSNTDNINLRSFLLYRILQPSH